MYSQFNSFLTWNEQQTHVEPAVDLTNQPSVMEFPNLHPKVEGQH